MIIISQLLLSNIRATVAKGLASRIDNHIAIALTSQDVQTLGLPSCDGYIVVRSSEELKRVLPEGMAYEGTKLDNTLYPVCREVVEWSVLPRYQQDLAVGRGFWVSALRHAQQGKPLHSNLTPGVVLSCIENDFPSR